MDTFDIIDRLSRIETKVDAIMLSTPDHEKRLRGLERERWLYRGALGAAAFLSAKLGLPVG